jgi:hypothetical protein
MEVSSMGADIFVFSFKNGSGLYVEKDRGCGARDVVSYDAVDASRELAVVSREG